MRERASSLISGARFPVQSCGTAGVVEVGAHRLLVNVGVAEYRAGLGATNAPFMMRTDGIAGMVTCANAESNPTALKNAAARAAQIHDSPDSLMRKPPTHRSTLAKAARTLQKAEQGYGKGCSTVNGCFHRPSRLGRGLLVRMESGLGGSARTSPRLLERRTPTGRTPLVAWSSFRNRFERRAIRTKPLATDLPAAARRQGSLTPN